MTRLWNRALAIIYSGLTVGCSTIQSRGATAAPSTDTETCKIRPDVQLEGQLRVHYHGMHLKLYGCPMVEPMTQNLKFDDAEELNKIWAVLPYPRNSHYKYVDIKFLASELANRDILMERIISARLTDESRYYDE